jgi:hypothetical protein
MLLACAALVGLWVLAGMGLGAEARRLTPCRAIVGDQALTRRPYWRRCRA